MIDRVRMYETVVLNEEDFNPRFKRMTYVTKDTGESKTVYTNKEFDIKIDYYPDSGRIVIEGRLINMSYRKNKVDNLDVLWSGIEGNNGYEDYNQSISDIVEQLNDRLYTLTNTELDIRFFTVSSIEISFNVDTEYVGKYIALFNLIFQERADKRYVNYALITNKDLESSYYIKTKSDYDNKKTKNCVINFYNKFDQLKDMNKNNENRDFKTKVTEEDLQLAKNKLRLEIKCSYLLLDRLCKEHILERKFYSFLDIDLCQSIIIDKYKSFLDCHTYSNFYSYQEAKQIIETSCIKDKKKLLDYLKSISQNSVHKHFTSKATQKKYNDLLASLGIHHFLIPKTFKINFLESPMKLLNNRISMLKHNRELFITKHNRENANMPRNRNSDLDCDIDEEIERMYRVLYASNE